MSVLYFIVRRIASVLFHLAARIDLQGAENVPAGGSFLLTPNHLNYFDTPLLFVAVPRRLRVFAAVKYRRNPFLHVLFESMGCIWVRQFEADHQALREAMAFLRGGGALGIAPEGTRSRETHALLPGQGGAALLASRTGAAIVPAAVWGTETLAGSLRRLRRGTVHVRIGKPYRLEVSPRAKVQELDAATDDVMCAIAALLPPPYRGVYADNPRLPVWLERTRG
jgi:1-acyl-sn-glycerol-3-phosphate acyltransferase